MLLGNPATNQPTNQNTPTNQPAKQNTPTNQPAKQNQLGLLASQSESTKHAC
jgi:hypothetical protein